jgi:hypothetical protein
MESSNTIPSIAVTSTNFRRRAWIAPLIVAVVVLAVYWPAISNDFVEWDDLMLILSNPRFNPPTWASVGWYWTHAAWNLYMPLTCTLWAGLAKLGWVATPDQFGGHMDPYVFHLAGLLLHLAAALSLFAILRRAVRNDGAAMIGALVFAVHPIQVEAVAFVGALNNPLFASLSLFAIWQYLRFGSSCTTATPGSEVRRRPGSAAEESGSSVYLRTRREGEVGRWGSFIAGSIALILAMLAKPTAVVVPAVALVLDLAVNHRPWRKAVRSILPWVVLVVPCVVWTKLFQHGAAAPSPLWSRPFIAGDAFTFYLGKLVFPFNLGIDYGHNPPAVLANALSYVIWVIPAGLLVLAWLIRRSWPLLAAGVVIFLVALLPNSGLVPFDYQKISTTADRYVYLSMMGPALAVAVLLARRWTRVLVTLAVVVLVGWAALSEVQIQTWRNGGTLFRHAIEVNPGSWMARINLGNIVTDRSPDEGIRLCREALELHPDSPIAYNNLGSALMMKGDRAAAVEAFAAAHRLDPAAPLYAANYARALAENQRAAREQRSTTQR